MTELITATPASIARIQTIDEAAELARRAEAAARVFDKVQNKHRNAQQARAVYLLAARRAGELLLEVPRSNGGRPNSFELQLVTLYQEAKDAAGVSDYTAQVWQRLAEIEQEIVENYLHDPKYMLTEYTVNSLVTFAFGKRETVKTLEGSLKTAIHFVKVVADRDDFKKLPEEIKQHILDLLVLFDEQYYDVV